VLSVVLELLTQQLAGCADRPRNGEAARHHAANNLVCVNKNPLRRAAQLNVASAERAWGRCGAGARAVPFAVARRHIRWFD
jgi:hypothetical protein